MLWLLDRSRQKLSWVITDDMSSKLEPTSYRSLDRSIEYVKNVKFLNEDDVIRLCDEVRQIFLEESNVPIIQTPCTIVGDIHGQFLDLLEMFEIGFLTFLMISLQIFLAGQPPYTNFLFLGDYVDRGRQCVCISYLMIELLCFFFIL